MKLLKTSLPVLLMLAFFSTSAMAQSQLSDNADVAVSASAVSGITVTNASDIDFGTIAIGDTTSIAANSAGAGSVSVFSGISGASFDISVLYPTTLAGTSGSISLAAPTGSSVKALDGTTSAPGSSADLTGASVDTQTLTGTFTSAGTDFFIYVGAQIASSASAVAGITYSSPITVTVSYQ